MAHTPANASHFHAPGVHESSTENEFFSSFSETQLYFPAPSINIQDIAHLNVTSSGGGGGVDVGANAGCVTALSDGGAIPDKLPEIFKAVVRERRLSYGKKSISMQLLY
jgi:hypothetical protein